MRFILSERAIELTELITPYLEWDGKSCHVREDAPEEIKQAYSELIPLLHKEYAQAQPEYTQAQPII